MTIKVLLATLVLFAPLILLAVLTLLVESSQRFGRRFDATCDKADAAIVRTLNRYIR